MKVVCVMSIKGIINYERGELAKCEPANRLIDVIQLMAHCGLRALAVVDADEKLVGIITEHDIIQGLALHKGRLDHSSVSEFMAKSLITCSPDTRLIEALQLMGRHKIHDLVIVKDAHPVMIVSATEILSKLHDRDEVSMNNLRHMLVTAAL